MLDGVIHEVKNLKGDVSDLKSEVAFLKRWKEATDKGMEMLNEIKALQDSQIRKFKKLKARLEGEFIPILVDLASSAPDEECKGEILSFRAKLRNNLTRAEKKLVG